ncbi:hypothetical protein [Colidextribacter sp. OB.20]|uniref:hypothetical protein n=1 Tax=Colidextribacter sp. OB.20 TaxID=2304568 RepID=UPI00136B24E0|nr:hypothetical protein [Colidextribacter sp. OB.20]
MKVDNEYLEFLTDAIAGIDLTQGEKRTLEWVAGWEKSTVKNIASIIIKAKAAAQ